MMPERNCSLSPEIQKKIVDGLLGLFGDNIDRIILYGSAARGDDGPDSDVDVAVIVKEKIDYDTEKKLIRWNAGLDMENEKIFSVLDIEKDDFDKKKDLLFFYRNINREGIVLWKAA